MSTRTVATEVFKGMVGSLHALGLSPSDLYAGTTLTPDLVDDDEGRVPFEHVVEFGLWIRDQRGQRAGILMAEAMASSEHFLLGYVLASSSTLGEAYESWVRYRRIGFEGSPYELTVRHDEVELGCVYPDEAVNALPGLLEGYVAFSLAKGRHITGQRWSPNLVLLQGPETDADLYESFFDAPVQNHADRSAIIFSSRLLELPVVHADPRLRAYLENVADRVLAELPEAETFVDTVRSEVMNALKDGQPTLEGIADRLHMSPRTVQRRLEKEAASFGNILDSVRRAAALEYLRDRHVAISEAAYLLGFSEPSTFYRAFKRWTGSTPADYRRSQLA